MAFITSRNYPLPVSEADITNRPFYHLWKIRMWPYQELVAGDTLYFYESNSQMLVWKTKVADVLRFTYADKATAAQRLAEWNGNFDPTWSYFTNAASSGYCLAYTVCPVEKIELPKPEFLRFRQDGWLLVDAGTAQTWLGAPLQNDDYEAVLDDIAPTGGVTERLQQLSEKLAGVAPDRVTSLVTRTIRRDTSMVKALKAALDWRCQYPDCGVRIPTKDGGWYVEVAHIKSVAQGGLSVLGNLLVLCPNHHKEFDFGSLTIEQQTDTCVQGVLNGKPFAIVTKPR